MNRRTLGRTGLAVSEIGFGAWASMKREGLIRHYGVSVHPPEEGLADVQATMPDTVQIVYNLARREAEHTFLATAQAANVGVIAPWE